MDDGRWAMNDGRWTVKDGNGGKSSGQSSLWRQFGGNDSMDDDIFQSLD